MPRIVLTLTFALLFAVPISAAVPVIYSTDLYHPHDDPDDHYDLACLYALPELDVKCVIIDMANIREKRSYHGRPKKPGLVALEQMEHLTGRQLPCVTGLEHPLKSVDDPGTDQPESTQGAVNKILSVLRESEEKVAIFTVGSLVDVAAAFNREPDLLREKVRAIYINAGTGPDGYQEEWNVRLDQNAYQRILLSDLPVESYPCFGRDGYFTHFVVDQNEVLGSAPAPLRAFFAYALDRSTEAPIPFLSGDYPPPQGPRNMWCTPSFVDLAGRKIYKTDKGYEALAEPPQPDAAPVNCYQMQPVKLALGKVPTRTTEPPGLPCFQANLNVAETNVHVIHKQEPEYTEVMTSVLKNLLTSGRYDSRN
jgi:inosine-uridine preferring nucleoside hydrolase